MLTPQDWHKLILLEVGAGLDGNDAVERKALDKVTPNIELIWGAWAEKGMVFPRLQYLYAKKQCLDIIEGQFRDLVSVTINGLNQNQQQRLQNLQTLNKRVSDEITVLEKKAAAVRSPVISNLNQTAPSMPGLGQLDPQNPVYRGDAIVRPATDDPLGWQRSATV